MVKEINRYEFDYLSGAWDGGWGAALAEVSEFCAENGLGTYGKPTKRGQESLDWFEKNKVVYVKPAPFSEVVDHTLKTLQKALNKT